MNFSHTMWNFVQQKCDVINEALYENADLRTRNMLFMGRLEGVLAVALMYVVFTVVGPRIMAKHKPFDLKWTMFVYNVIIAIWSLWMFLEMFLNSRVSGYNYLCDTYRLSYKPSDLRIANAMWWYWISKAVEFLDTVFMVLKKKNSQISFLHVYHHTFMFPFLYFGVLFWPCCQAVVGPIMNSFVHVVMYTYYALSLFPTLQPYLWWKKYLTQLQLSHFFVLMATTATALVRNCNYPHSGFFGYVQMGFMLSLVVLFGNFYIQAYIKRQKQKGCVKTKTAPTETTQKETERKKVI